MEKFKCSCSIRKIKAVWARLGDSLPVVEEGESRCSDGGGVDGATDQQGSGLMCRRGKLGRVAPCAAFP